MRGSRVYTWVFPGFVCGVVYGVRRRVHASGCEEGAGVGGAPSPLQLLQAESAADCSLQVRKAVGFKRKVLFRGITLFCAVLPFLVALTLHRIAPFLVSKEFVHELLLNLFTSSGPCFLKLGQWAATRPDKFSKEFCDVVGKLHHDAPSHSWEDSEARIVAAYGATDMFESIERGPLHSGCIAQVHRARLKGEDRDVVIKVMHPNVEESIEVDLALIRVCVAGVEWLASHLIRTEWMSVNHSMHEFQWQMRNQVDLEREAHNLLKFRRNFNATDTVTFPMPVMRLASRTVMVETYEHGTPLVDWVATNPALLERLAVTKKICLALMKMVKEDNFVHGDLHPGNILIRDGGNEVVVIDAGIVTSLSPGSAMKFRSTLAAAMLGRGDAVAEGLMYGVPRIEGQGDGAAFRADVNALVRRNFALALQRKEIDTRAVCADVLYCFRTNNVAIDASFSAMITSVYVAEGLRKMLWPEGSTTQLITALLHKAENKKKQKWSKKPEVSEEKETLQPHNPANED